MPPEQPFDPSADERTHRPTEAMPRAEEAGAMIGRYRLLQKIGEGGMGEVWLAEQKESLRRRVALKLLKSGISSREIIARFESERQALALMDHSAIAKVLDAGTTPQGGPYFVMEYVPGIPITDYCDKHRLSLRDRLELFVRVCEGVQHAHQKAIIHRDLKPSNVLVAEVDGRPLPKIIDFGVAKALTQKLTAETMFTRVGAIVGTPEYMSPEQARSSGEDIDTRTDVYSLGIVFYELLAGAPPLELRKIAFEEFLRRLREDDPPKLSTKIRTQEAARLTEVARQRQVEPREPGRLVEGELDAIALKALEKEPGRRYGSATEFAADIGRYLKNEPVQAVEPSFAYQAGKFARRHRAGLATACAFVVVLVAAAIVSLRQSIRASREAATAESINQFLRDDVLSQASVWNQAAAGVQADPDLKVRAALDRAAARIEGKFRGRPEVEAAIRETMGRAYLDIGIMGEADKQLQPAVALYTTALGAGHPKTLRCVAPMGTVLASTHRQAEAEALLTRNLEISRRVLGPEHPATVELMEALRNLYWAQRKYKEGLALQSQVLELRRRRFGPEQRDTLKATVTLADFYNRLDRYAAAEALLTETLSTAQRVLGPEDPETLACLGSLTIALHGSKKYQEEERLQRQLLEIDQRVFGQNQKGPLKVMGNLAETYRAEGRVAEAEALHKKVLEMRRKLLGSEDADTLWSMSSLAGVYLNEGRYAEAEAQAREALEIRERTLGPGHPDTLQSLHWLADTYEAQGDFARSAPLRQKLVDLQPDNPTYANNYAWLLAKTPNLTKAEAKKALELAHRAVKGAPGNGNYYNTLGLVQYRNDLWDEAVATLHQSAELNKGKDPTDFLFLAMAQWRLEHKPEAEEVFQRWSQAVGKQPSPEKRLFWAEAAKLMGKPGPPPVGR
jgi:non-specific serine/threonine protein kinase/serine/threonine-protein kinase